ncbi:class I tRNA ligase family protein [Candidatus Parcubacteria bacterium]|nr:class I tRNA ligase family protein [Candidatus Parcubacteria bacterium]
MDEEKDDQKLEENEKNLFTVHWLSKDEAEQKVVDENHALLFQKFIRNKPYTGTGILTNSGKFDGKTSKEVYKDIIKFAGGTLVTKFKLRDWVFSRQRYWGEPIPVILCEKCGVVPVPESDLPVELPVVEKYEPGPDGESPLANVETWVNVKCPKCESPAKRETDVMPNWAGSSWYFLRYADPENDKEFASKKALKYWMPVDWYNGGMEHTTLHLLYSRFWNKFLYDLKLVPTDEPYKKRTSHGLILAEGGEKMSKSKGNVINPDTIVKRFGADTLRLYEMFMGPFDQAIAWSEDALVGPYRFIERVWKLKDKVSTDKVRISEESIIHLNQTIKKVSDDIETMNFNTAISTLMIHVNSVEKQSFISSMEYKVILKLLATFAPHVTEELWSSIGEKNSIHTESWPEFDEKKLEGKDVTIVVQVNGKTRATIVLDKSTDESQVKTLALDIPEVKKWLNGATPQRIVVVPGRLVNIVL